MTELDELRAKMTTLNSSRTATLDDMMASEIFNHFEFEHNLPEDTKLTDKS